MRRDNMSLAGMCAAMLALSCVPIRNDNPYDPSFGGDYRLSVGWPADSTVLRSLEILEGYRFAVTTGTDAFTELTVEGPVDAAQLNASYRGGDSLLFVFTSTCTTLVRVGGVCPNGKTVACDSARVRVTNPYRIAGGGNYAYGARAALTIERTDARPERSGILVEWNGNDTSTISLAYFDTVKAAHSVFATLLDRYGNRFGVPAVQITVDNGKPCFTGRAALDTSVFVYDTATLSVTASPGAPGRWISRYVWRRGISVIQSDSSSRTSVSYRGAAMYDTLRVWAVDDHGDTTTAPFVMAIRIYQGSPLVDTAWFSPTVTFINTAATLSVLAHDTNGVVTAIEIDTSDDSVADVSLNVPHLRATTGSISLHFGAPQNVRVSLRARDDDGIAGPWHSSSPLIVTGGEPIVTGLKCDTVWWKTRRTIFIQTSDNGTVDSCAVSIDGTTWRPYRKGVSIDTAFADTGVQRMYVRVKDNDGMVSATYHDSVRVLPGEPRVKRLDMNPGPLFVHDDIRCTLSVSDPNGRVDTVAVSLDGGVNFARSARLIGDTSVGHAGVRCIVDTAFAEPGRYIVAAVAIDNDGLISDTLRDTLTILRGTPVVNTAQFIDPGDVLNFYVNDGFAVQLGAVDTNGTIQSCRITFLKIDQSDSLVFTGTSTRATGMIPIDKWGDYAVYASVIDDDGIRSARVQLSSFIRVRRGTPQVTGFGASAAAVWVFDNITYQYSVNDPNGIVDSVFFDWGDGSAVQAVRVGQKAPPLPLSIQHTYTGESVAGVHTVSLRVRDDDRVDTTYAFPVLVRRGRPDVHFAGEYVHDTLVVPSFKPRLYNYYRFGSRDVENLTLHAVSQDTNGTIVRHYWNLAGALDTNAAMGASTVGDSVHLDTTFFLAHTPHFMLDTTYRIAVLAKDDDGLMAHDTASMYIDGPPTYPRYCVQAVDTPSDTIVRYEWSTLDRYDQDSTLIKIVFANPRYDSTWGLGVAQKSVTRNDSLWLTYKNGFVSYVAMGQYYKRTDPVLGKVYGLDLVIPSRMRFPGCRGHYNMIFDVRDHNGFGDRFSFFSELLIVW